DVLADQAPEGLEPKLHVGAQPGQCARVHALGLGRSKERFEVRLDFLPRKLIPDPAREVADLEEVKKPLEPESLPALTDRQLEGGGVRKEQHLGERIDVELVPLLLEETLEQVPRPRILAAEGFRRLRAQALQVEEVEIEDPLEGREITRLLDQGCGE